MATFQISLMERRKKNLGSLKTTIQYLSILNKKLQSPLFSPSLSTNHSKSLDQKGSSESTNESTLSFLQSVPFVQASNSSECSIQQQESLKTFDQTYENLQVLGEGAHGVVKKCVHRITGQQFAVKILQMQDQHLHFLKMSFINIKKLKNDGIIKYKALFLNSKQRKCHLVMQFLPFFHLKKGLTEEQLKIVFYNLLNSLQYIHKNSICHRDIKPQNILYDKQNHVFKIIDFGVSKNMNLRGRYEQMLTKTGTLYYKAPQMFDGGSYTQKVDCWAVGVTLYEMIVGTTPFASEYLGQTIQNILQKQIDFNLPQFSHYDPIVKTLIKQLLNRNPRQRLSCQEAKKHLWFNADLEEISILRSAHFNLQSEKKSEERQPKDFNYVLKKDSLTEPKNVELNPISNVDKRVIKKWFQILNDTQLSIPQQVSIDFVQCQREDSIDQLKILTPKKMTSALLNSKTRMRERQQLQRSQNQHPKNKQRRE